MCIASGHGVTLDPDVLAIHDPFAERPGCYLLELRLDPEEVEPIVCLLEDLPGRFSGVAEVVRLGTVQSSPRLVVFNQRMGQNKERITELMSVDELTTAWRGTLDW
jgi:hypothetical protein